jgi:hypothetical protein
MDFRSINKLIYNEREVEEEEEDEEVEEEEEEEEEDEEEDIGLSLHPAELFFQS